MIYVLLYRSLIKDGYKGLETTCKTLGTILCHPEILVIYVRVNTSQGHAGN
jgi:hypothetical protein